MDEMKRENNQRTREGEKGIRIVYVFCTYCNMNIVYD